MKCAGGCGFDGEMSCRIDRKYYCMECSKRVLEALVACWNSNHNPATDPIAQASKYGVSYVFGGKTYDGIAKGSEPAYCRVCGKSTPMTWSGNVAADNPLGLRIGRVRELEGWFVGRFMLKYVEDCYPNDPDENLFICGPCVPSVLERIDEMGRPA